MATNKLENFRMYLWKNPEGFHVTVVTNYSLPTEKRSFFSFGEQTYKSWRAYNLHQPEPLKDFFAQFKQQYRNGLKEQSHYWISKLGVNTGNKGRRTAPGVMIMFEDNGCYGFVLKLAEHEFKGVFNSENLSDKQRKGAKGVCLGEFVWNDDDAITEYAEAF